MSKQLLSVRNFSATFINGPVQTEVLHKISFDVKDGETVALVGESGSGKSVMALNVLRLLNDKLCKAQGEIDYLGQNLLEFNDKQMQPIRGGEIAMIFQEPMTSLNALHRVEKQIGESLIIHKNYPKDKIRGRVQELLTLVGFKDTKRIISSYPHELSGGQRQRVMIAMALAGEPKLLIADEPTTALDVTTQATILELLEDLKQKLNMSMLFITHDLGIVNKIADRVVVLKNGDIVEQGDKKQIFTKPSAQYTKDLLSSVPKGSPDPINENENEVFSCKDITVKFPIKKSLFQLRTDYFTAVDDISFSLKPRETIGIVGESGSGKTSLAMAILKLIESHGSIKLLNVELQNKSGHQIRPLRRQMQMIFQDPFASLSPRMSIEEIIGEGLEVHKLTKSKHDYQSQIVDAMKLVGLDPATRHRYPHEFSGGQRQRIAIARAIVLRPALLILDEPTSALDRSIQVDVVNLLRDLQKKFAMAYIFISHDLSIVKAMSHKLIVMKDGEVVEKGTCEQIFANPSNDYTKILMQASLGMHI